MTAANDNDFADFDAYDMDPETFVRWFGQVYAVDYMSLEEALADNEHEGGDPFEDYALGEYEVPTNLRRVDGKVFSHIDIENIQRFVDIITGKDPEDPQRLERFPEGVSVVILAEEGDDAASFVPEFS